MRYRKRSVERYFSTHYHHYMPTTPEGWAWVIKRIDLNFGNALTAVPRDRSILDVACGVGYLEHYLLKGGFAQIHAIDLSREQIEAAEMWLQQLGIDYVGKVRFEVIDAFECLQKPDCYAAIAMLDFIEHFAKDEVLELLDRAHRALNTDGLLLIRTPNAENPMFGRFFNDFTHETPFTMASMAHCLTLTGFRVNHIGCEVLPGPPGPLGIRGRLDRWARSLGLRILGRLFEMQPETFSPDLVAIAQR